MGTFGPMIFAVRFTSPARRKTLAYLVGEPAGR
jgi:hypothetical protein